MKAHVISDQKGLGSPVCQRGGGSERKGKKKRKKKYIVFEHLMLSEKNNEFSCLKTTNFAIRVWIIENIFMENVFKLRAEVLHAVLQAVLLHTQMPTAQFWGNLTSLHPLSPRVNEAAEGRTMISQIIETCARVGGACPSTVVSQAGLE